MYYICTFIDMLHNHQTLITFFHDKFIYPLSSVLTKFLLRSLFAIWSLNVVIQHKKCSLQKCCHE